MKKTLFHPYSLKYGHEFLVLCLGALRQSASSIWNFNPLDIDIQEQPLLFLDNNSINILRNSCFNHLGIFSFFYLAAYIPLFFLFGNSMGNLLIYLSFALCQRTLINCEEMGCTALVFYLSREFLLQKLYNQICLRDGRYGKGTAL